MGYMPGVGPPSVSISSYTFSSFGTERPINIIVAPYDAKVFAATAPIPSLAPVTAITFPCK